jgi:hypothetical protein
MNTMRQHRSWLTLLVGTLTAAAVISMLSGYVATPLGRDIRWQLTPLGLVTDFDPNMLVWSSGCRFAGRLGTDFDYLWTFLKTCLLESAFFAVLLKESGYVRALALCAAANFISHPIVFFAFPCLFERYFTALMSSEAFAPAIEIIFILGMEIWRLKKMPPRGLIVRVILLITAANLFSWQTGLLL